jgi:hypothetical protein
MRLGETTRNMMVRVIKRFKEAKNITYDVPHVYVETVETLNETYSRNYTNYTQETRTTYGYSTEIVDVFDIDTDINISIPVGTWDRDGVLQEAPTMPPMTFIKPVAKR